MLRPSLDVFGDVSQDPQTHCVCEQFIGFQSSVPDLFGLQSISKTVSLLPHMRAADEAEYKELCSISMVMDSYQSLGHELYGRNFKRSMHLSCTAVFLGFVFTGGSETWDCTSLDCVNADPHSPHMPPLQRLSCLELSVCGPV